jgi:AbrB family looped-hinge helix DNA binding protein
MNLQAREIDFSRYHSTPRPVMELHLLPVIYKPSSSDGHNSSSGPPKITTLVRWGNSVGIALPKPIRDGIKLKAGDKLKIVLQNDKICIERIYRDIC